MRDGNGQLAAAKRRVSGPATGAVPEGVMEGELCTPSSPLLYSRRDSTVGT